MVDSEVKRILRGQNLAANLLAVVVGGMLFGFTAELGRIALRKLLKDQYHMDID